MRCRWGMGRSSIGAMRRSSPSGADRRTRSGVELSAESSGGRGGNPRHVSGLAVQLFLFLESGDVGAGGSNVESVDVCEAQPRSVSSPTMSRTTSVIRFEVWMAFDRAISSGRTEAGAPAPSKQTLFEASCSEASHGRVTWGEVELDCSSEASEVDGSRFEYPCCSSPLTLRHRSVRSSQSPPSLSVRASRLGRATHVRQRVARRLPPRCLQEICIRIRSASRTTPRQPYRTIRSITGRN